MFRMKLGLKEKQSVKQSPMVWIRIDGSSRSCMHYHVGCFQYRVCYWFLLSGARSLKAWYYLAVLKPSVVVIVPGCYRSSPRIIADFCILVISEGWSHSRQQGNTTRGWVCKCLMLFIPRETISDFITL